MKARKDIPRHLRCARSNCTRIAVVIPGENRQLCLAHEKVRGKSRYGVRKARGEARAYGSKWEAERGAELILMERQGLLSDLKFQVWFHLVIAGVRIESYVADATYVEHGKLVVEDSKAGLLTPDYLRKRKWMKAALGITIREHHKPRR